MSWNKDSEKKKKVTRPYHKLFLRGLGLVVTSRRKSFLLSEAIGNDFQANSAADRCVRDRVLDFDGSCSIDNDTTSMIRSREYGGKWRRAHGR